MNTLLFIHTQLVVGYLLVDLGMHSCELDLRLYGALGREICHFVTMCGGRKKEREMK